MLKTTKGTIVVLIVGAVLGAAAVGGFAGFVQYSNTLEFCTSCHEMRDTVFQEFKKTAHYKNQLGVRAVCADCHVPHGNWVATLAVKIPATKELIYHFIGISNTPEKLDAKRLELAQHVWAKMEANDSRECRNCHSWDAMLIDKQRKPIQVKHRDAIEEGKTCIDCHKGIAHKPVHKELEEEGGESQEYKL